MAAGVVLDTSFLITLAGAGREHHHTARRYWRHFSENGIPLYLPTIVVSEFCIRQEIPPELLRACVVLPFNWDDAQKAAALDFSKADRGLWNKYAFWTIVIGVLGMLILGRFATKKPDAPVQA